MTRKAARPTSSRLSGSFSLGDGWDVMRRMREVRGCVYGDRVLLCGQRPCHGRRLTIAVGADSSVATAGEFSAPKSVLPASAVLLVEPTVPAPIVRRNPRRVCAAKGASH